MNLTKNILRGRLVHRAQGRQWLMLLAALFAWLLPQQAVADGDYTTYVDMSYNYGVSLDGSNTVKIHVPVYQQEGIGTTVFMRGSVFISAEEVV